MAQRLTIDELRARMLQWILVVISVAGTLAVVSVAFSATTSVRKVTAAFYAAVIALVYALTLRRSMRYTVRLYLTLGLMFAVGITAVIVFGAGRGRPMLLTVVVLAAALGGLRVGLVALTGAAAAIAVAAVLHVGEVLQSPPVRSDSVVDWAGNAFTFLMMGGGLLAVVALLNQQVLAQVREADALVVELRERNAVLKALSTTATRLLVAPRWEEVAVDILEDLGTATGVARCQISQFSGEGDARTFTPVFVWAAEGVDDWADDPAAREVEPVAVGLGPYLDQLERGESYSFATRDLAEPARTLLGSLHVESGLGVPILVDGALWGFLGFSEQERERDWAPLVEVLTVAGSSIGVAIARQRLRLELEQRVEERTADLAAVNRDLEAFTHSVSHDLRAPLRHASAYARLVGDRAGDRLDDEGRRHLANVMSATERMATMVAGLLEFSRLGRAAITKRRVELAPLVRALIDERATDLQGRDVTWQVDPLPAVDADPTLIRQVLANLIDNAIKYTRGTDPTTIHVGVGADAAAGEVSVFVKDDGVGFDMAYADELFGVFRRLHADSEFEGSGIGLALARRIVERHGGRCWASAAPGEGATFWLSLPVTSHVNEPPRR